MSDVIDALFAHPHTDLHGVHSSGTVRDLHPIPFLISGYEPIALQSYRKYGEAQKKNPYFLTHAHERTRSPHPHPGHGRPIPYYIYRNGPDDGPPAYLHRQRALS